MHKQEGAIDLLARIDAFLTPAAPQADEPAVTKDALCGINDGYSALAEECIRGILHELKREAEEPEARSAMPAGSWISVRERMPEVCVEVLVFMGGACSVAWVDGGGRWWRSGNRFNTPSYWMILPQIPQPPTSEGEAPLLPAGVSESGGRLYRADRPHEVERAEALRGHFNVDPNASQEVKDSVMAMARHVSETMQGDCVRNMAIGILRAVDAGRLDSRSMAADALLIWTANHYGVSDGSGIKLLRAETDDVRLPGVVGMEAPAVRERVVSEEMVVRALSCAYPGIDWARYRDDFPQDYAHFYGKLHAAITAALTAPSPPSDVRGMGESK